MSETNDIQFELNFGGVVPISEISEEQRRNAIFARDFSILLTILLKLSQGDGKKEWEEIEKEYKRLQEIDKERERLEKKKKDLENLFI